MSVYSWSIKQAGSLTGILVRIRAVAFIFSMDLNIIRAEIFFVAGLIVIIFRKQLNNIKNKLLIKINIKPKDERKTYIYFGILFFIISFILLMFGLIR